MFLQGATEIYKMQNNLYLSSQSRKYEIYQEFLQLVMKYYTIHHGTSFYAEHLGLSLPHFCSTIKKGCREHSFRSHSFHHSDGCQIPAEVNQ